MNGKSDPYLRFLYGQTRLKTTIQKKTLNPNWRNESFLIPLEESDNILKASPDSSIRPYRDAEGLALPEDNAHSPNERFSLECFEKGMAMSAHLWPELSNAI